jgi:chromosome segregation ATPase
MTRCVAKAMSGRCALRALLFCTSLLPVWLFDLVLITSFPSLLQVIADTLAEYSGNIDAAIRHLTELRLTVPGAALAARKQASDADAALEQAEQHLPQQNHQGSEQVATASTVEDGSSDGAATPTARRSAEQWVDLVVEQMAQAKDLDDAKRRASELLRAFEHDIMQHASTAAGDGRTAAELARENTLLKRAVAIQNARLQELSAGEAEAQQLRATVDALQARAHALEVHNYSLQVHLRRAADSRDPLGQHRSPDVF